MKNAIYFLLGAVLVAAIMLAIDTGSPTQPANPDYQAYSRKNLLEGIK